MDLQFILKKNLHSAIQNCQESLNNTHFLNTFEIVTQLIIKQYQSGGRLYIAGNGGSAADSQHLAAEFLSKLAQDRNPLPAEALSVDTSVITAIGNDYGYEKIFARQLIAKATPKDVFLGITTSGNSQNIIEALKICTQNNIPSVLLTGHQGGEAINLADYCLIAPAKTTSGIQEMHAIIYHSLCEAVEKELCFNKLMTKTIPVMDT